MNLRCNSIIYPSINNKNFRSMKKFYFLAALVAGTALTSCTSEDDLALSPPEVNNVEDGYAPIVFSSVKNNFTRADFDGAEAAAKLGNMFVVSGYKGSKSQWQNADDPTNNIKKSSIVFDNYLVVFKENTANSSESNTKNWEYVGVEDSPIPHASKNGITKQTIKYWDYSQAQYDFIAWSTGTKTPIYNDDDLNDGEVRVSAITPKTAVGDATTDDDVIAYKFEGKAADLRECYVADLVTVKKDGTTAGKYKETVTLKFRQLGTKIRIGIYETVPGYSVKNVEFYPKGGVFASTTDDSDPANPVTTPDPDLNQINSTPKLFTQGANIYTEGTYTVYFPTVDDVTDSDNNQAHIKFAAKDQVPQTTLVTWDDDLNYTYRESGESDINPVYLGRSSNTATYAGDPDDNYYVIYLPNETSADLNLRVNFTLESIDGSGEIIEVKNARAQVPSIYTAWKPGFAYTYLFKISDNTNGRTGVYDPAYADDATFNSDPAGLYPITFDAIVVNAEDGDQTQETITTIATPSITTYQKESTVVNADEYTVNGKDIFVTVNGNMTTTEAGGENNGGLITMNTDAATADGVALYSIPSGMTEAEVIDALTYQDDDDKTAGTILGRSGKVLTIATNVASDADLTEGQWKLTNTVEFGVNGNVIEVADNQALRFMPVASTTYAFVYTKTAADANKNKVIYEPIKFSELGSFTGIKYRYDYKDTEKSHTVDATDYYDAQKGHVYFKKTGDTYERENKPFIGQVADNLYTRTGNGTTEPYEYTKCSGYAVSGTQYFYTTKDNEGKPIYEEAHSVTYAANMLPGGLYEFDSSTKEYKTTTDNALVEGKAYYNKDGEKYVYCVFMPMQVVKDTYYEIDEQADKVETTETPVEGQTYFDQYLYNSAERYAKVIKVAATPQNQQGNGNGDGQGNGDGNGQGNGDGNGQGNGQGNGGNENP